MAVLKIEMLGSPILRQPAEEVVEVDDDLRVLIQDMFATMYDAEGIGLAAPQVGVSRRVIVVDINEEESKPFALINPRLVETSRLRDKADEGCLSIPGLSAAIERPAQVRVEGIDEQGQPVRIEADGMLARCLQHEIDHLDGILFIDRVSALQRDMLIRKWKKQKA